MTLRSARTVRMVALLLIFPNASRASVLSRSVIITRMEVASLAATRTKSCARQGSPVKRKKKKKKHKKKKKA